MRSSIPTGPASLWLFPPLSLDERTLPLGCGWGGGLGSEPQPTASRLARAIHDNVVVRIIVPPWHLLGHTGIHQCTPIRFYAKHRVSTAALDFHAFRCDRRRGRCPREDPTSFGAALAVIVIANGRVAPTVTDTGRLRAPRFAPRVAPSRCRAERRTGRPTAHPPMVRLRWGATRSLRW